MSWRMDVKVERVLEDGDYDAKLTNVERKETKFGERLMWTFEVDGENVEVVGFTSMSPSTKAKAYQWAAAIMGEINPKLGWGPEDVIGGECVVVLEEAEDAQGTEKNKVVKVKPPRKDKPAASMAVCNDIDPSPYSEFNAAAKETVTSQVHPQSRTSGEWVNCTDYRCKREADGPGGDLVQIPL